MKATLEFNLDDFDDRTAHLRAVKSLDIAMVLWQLVMNSKKGIEYELEGRMMKGEEVNALDALDLVFDRIHDLLEEHDVNIDKYIV